MADVEKVINVNLTKSYEYTRTRRTERTVKILRDFIGKSTKADDVKLSNALNSSVWCRGIEKPPRKIKVRVIVRDGVASVYLPDEKIEKETKKAEKKEGANEQKKEEKTTEPPKPAKEQKGPTSTGNEKKEEKK
ncbi:MAG: 50S ribosomal protein L31e [Candidatus Micrarchaeota archaeon]